MAARTDLAMPLLERAQEVRERLGDPRAIAGVVALRARALADGRQHDASAALLESALDRFADLRDEAVGVQLAGILARNKVRLTLYDEGISIADRVLALAERLQLADIAIETLITKGQAYGFQGRMWEARALYEGARRMAEERGRIDLALAATQSLSFEIALDDARMAVELQRDAVVLARRLGRRAMEITILGNMSEDARRTGDWDWILGEIEAIISLHPEGRDITPLRLARQSLLAHRGEEDEAEIADIERVLDAIEDPDIAIGVLDIRGTIAFGGGRWGEAADRWLEATETSDLNEPYLLPRAGHAHVLAGNATGARAALDRLDEIGTRGRAVDADRTAIEAGIAALSGDAAAAVNGYQAANAAWRALRLPWDEALTALDAVTLLGTGDGEVADWAETARATFERLGAAPLLARLEEAVRSSATQGADLPVDPARLGREEPTADAIRG
jgi:tetratricopeptide (TPR) repeat protein